MVDSTFAQTLDYLYRLLPMYQRDGAVAFKKDLDNIKELCWQLGLPQWHFNSVHIAGTNGKGSVSSMLQAVLRAAGYRTGLYTSPHLVSFTERIRVNGKEMRPEKVVAFVEENRGLIERASPSFFELTVAMAFDHFAKSQVEIGVIETGLGGRLDSTNIIKPELSVITNISMDHQAMLGNSLAEIAGEKAGIIKTYTPVVIGRKQAETLPVFHLRASENKAPLFLAEDRFRLKRLSQTWEGQEWQVEDLEEETSFTLRLDLAGDYQEENLRTTLMAVEVMREDGWKISDRALKKGLANVRSFSGLRGRMEKIGDQPLTLTDTGHNEDGVKEVLNQLSGLTDRPLHIVWGMVSDKNHEEILCLLPKDAHYYWVKPEVPRGLDALTLSMKAESVGLKGEICNAVQHGLDRAKSQAEASEVIFVGGSTFVVAEVLT
ncbi:MAG: folylpolyglutamate synthase/dihydrofolate synthase family protein [Bacteroidota bacterium]